jgi:CheY-like chemotaxis protein
MSGAPQKQVLAVMTDLFFAVKILEAAKKEGMAARMVKTEEAAENAILQRPELVFLDLNCKEIDAVKLARKWKVDTELRSIPLIAFLSHVDVERKQAALDAGCDLVLARSSFTQNLPDLLKVRVRA